LISATNIVAVPAGCSLFHAVSMWAETTTSLILNDYRPAVSLFQDFREMASRISQRRFRPRLAQLEARVLSAENRETAQRQPISITKTKSYLFQPVLKRRETVRNSQHITPGARR
jgi:hypothetical protein